MVYVSKQRGCCCGKIRDVIIGIYHLEYFPGLKEGLEHVPFAEYFLHISRVNRVQAENLDVGNAKVNISPGDVGNGRNISGMTHSYPCGKKCTYRSVAMVKNPDAEGVYEQSQVKL